MNRSKIVAIVTGVIAIALSIAYLLIVQLLDFRGEMVPAPESWLPQPHTIALLALTVRGTTIDASPLVQHL